MKTHIIAILLFVAVMLSHKAAAADNNKYIPIMTPESATLGQFGAFPVSLYTGNVDVNIPIHTLKTSNITVPVSIQYNGTGFIPNKECGKIGHDWALVSGGAITRTVNGVPDEWEASGEPYDYGLNGMLYYMRNGDSTLTNENIRNLVYYREGNPIFETTPDIFSFNFLGHTGQFMIDHDCTVKVVGKNPYKVDISDLKTQKLGERQNISSITITDGDGTKYTFGGNIHALEIALKKRPSAFTTPFLGGVITAFHLTKVETTNGETVEFIYYDTKTGPNEGIFDSNGGLMANPNTVRTPFYSDFYDNIHSFGIWEEVTSAHAMEVSFSYTKVAYLHKIQSSQGENVVFEYVNREHPFTNALDNEDRMREWNHIINLRMNRILVYNSLGDIIKYATMHQSYKQSYELKNLPVPQNSYRMFLDSIAINNERYSFEYRHSGTYPVPQTRGIDLQGYYNGNDGNATLLSVEKPSDLQDFSHREPSFTDALNGMLRSITYPTGGTTQFIYENHNYGKAVVLNPLFMDLMTDNTSGLTGGVRIKEIINTPGDTLSYEYITKEAKSSGVINDVARYNMDVSVDPTRRWNVTGFIVQSGNNLMAGNTVAEPHIGYSRVIERRGKGNGYKVYTYTTFDDYKDQPVVGNDSNTIYNRNNLAPANLISASLHHTSMYLDRGKLTRLEEYDNQNTLVKETTYNYYNGEDRKADAIYSAGCRLRINGYYVTNSVAHYYYPKHLMSTETKEYVNGECITSQTDYTYNQHNQMVSLETTVNSNGDIVSKKTLYPKDCTPTDTLSAMIGQNMLNTVVKEEYYHNNSLVRTTENEFARYEGISSTSDYYDICAVKETIGDDLPYYPVRIHSRDKYRNIESLTEFGKPTTTYIWGYNGLYPLVKLENATYEQVQMHVSSAITTHSIEFNDSAHAPVLDRLGHFLPEALITRYDYKPQVGMTWRKEPNGMEYHYSYDNIGRLTDITYGEQLDVIKKFDYNIIHNNKLKAYWKDASPTIYTGNNTLVCAVSGGAKDYTFESLTLTKWNYQIASSTTDRITYNFQEEGTYTFSGTVKDNTTNEVATFSNTFNVIEPDVIEFSNKNQHEKIEPGSYTSSAVIHCKAPVTVSFSIFKEINSLSSATSYGCSIADSYFLTEYDEWPEKMITLELQEGDNYVEIFMDNIIGSGLIHITIYDIEGETAILGTDRTLSLFTEKAD